MLINIGGQIQLLISQVPAEPWGANPIVSKVLEYYIVEAKGPGAKLQDTKNKGMQMSDRWVKSNMNSMKNSKKYPEKKPLGQKLLKALKRKQPKFNKLVIEAVEDNGSVIGGKLQAIPNG